MATAPTNPLTYLPIGQTPATGTGTTPPAATPDRLRFPPPQMGMPLDAKGALPGTVGRMNQAMNAIFNGTIKTKSGEIIPNFSTQMFNMMGGSGGSGASGLTYTPGTTGGLTSTPTTPAAPTTTPAPASPQTAPSWMTPGSFGQGLQQRIQQFKTNPGGAMQGMGDMLQRHRANIQQGSPKWKALISSALSR